MFIILLIFAYFLAGWIEPYIPSFLFEISKDINFYISYTFIILLIIYFYVIRPFRQGYKETDTKQRAYQRHNDNSNEVNKLKNKIHKLTSYIQELETKLPKELTDEDKEAIKKYGDDFERFVGKKYEDKGYKVHYRGLELGLKDGGIDLVARRGEKIELVQCKYYKKPNSITSKIEKEFYGNCNFRLN